MLEDLFSIQLRLASSISTKFKRSLFNEINWNNRLIMITGARGTGKTTLTLQYLSSNSNNYKKCFYFSADNPIAAKQGIYNTAKEYFQNYNGDIIIDEAHKQKDWSVEVKALYDAYPDKKIIVLGSSALNLLNEKGDLSRRAIIYKMPILSFREYLSIIKKKNIAVITLEDILDKHEEIVQELLIETPDILKHFNKYLMNGSYPYFISYSEDEYQNILMNIMDKVIYEDIPSIHPLKPLSSLKMKKLIGYLALSKIPLFNTESLKNELEVAKDTLYEYLDMLNRAEIINIIRPNSNNLRAIKKSKILFKSSNIYYAVANDFWHNDADKGNIRESFLASQIGEKYHIFTSDKVDFMVILKNNKNIEIEVGGKAKTKKQIYDSASGYIFKDGIEAGNKNIIPLYLAGFLY